MKKLFPYLYVGIGLLGIGFIAGKIVYEQPIPAKLVEIPSLNVGAHREEIIDNADSSYVVTLKVDSAFKSEYE